MPAAFNFKKFVNAVLFFAEKDNIGITKLNKLLYYSDFEHYRLYGRPIIGDEYVKMGQGPVPERAYSIFNSNFRDAQDASLKDFIEVKPRLIRDFSEKTIVPKIKPNLDCFSQSELEIMEQVSVQYKGKTAAMLSSKTHEELPWKKTMNLQKIDYKLILERSDSSSVSPDYARYREKQDEELGVLLAR
jgi:uncharacterized phage-associated protein